MRKSNFIPAEWDSFLRGICVDLITSFLVYLCKHGLNYFFIQLRQAEIIISENFVPPNWNAGRVKEGFWFAGMKLFTCNCSI